MAVSKFNTSRVTERQCSGPRNFLQSARLLVILVLPASLIACSESSPNVQMSFELAEFTSSSTGRPAITLLATNTGDVATYNVSCDALAKDGNTIVDSAFLYFANGATITPGTSVLDTGVFFSLSSTNQFSTANWQCSYLVR